MESYYEYYDYGYEMGEELGAVFGVFYMIYMLVVIGMGIAAYVLRASGTYAIAKRRGISNPWLSWIPVADAWVLGSISDQFRYVTKGQIKSKRKILLTLNIVAVVIGVVAYVVMFAGLIGMAMEEGVYLEDEALAMNQAMDMIAGMLGYVLVVGGLSLATAIIRYMALYDLYTSVNPPYNVVFLVLSIIFNITEPFFIFFNRKKDLGMPPRCDVPEEPVYREPSYLPPREPWEKTDEA